MKLHKRRLETKGASFNVIDCIKIILQPKLKQEVDIYNEVYLEKLE